MIDRFTDEYFFLSNFYPQEIKYKGTVYPTTEHFYQAAKTANKEERAHIIAADTPAKAKKLGKNVNLRPDWEEIKVDVMRLAIHLKFQNEYLGKKLQETAPKELVEGNTWGDTFWGVCNGQGQNVLGKILMEERGKNKKMAKRKRRKIRPAVPRHFYWETDGCWFCDNRSGCSGCKVPKRYNAVDIKKERRKNRNINPRTVDMDM